MSNATLMLLLVCMAIWTLAMLPWTAIGLLVCWHVMRPQKSPADTSNRINKIRSTWFVLTREDQLAPHIPWMRRDELENLKQ